MRFNKINKILRDNIFYKINYCYDPSQLEVFRILVAVFSIISMFTLVLDYNVFFAPNGLITWEVSNANTYWFECHPQKIANLLHLPPNVVMQSIVGIYFLGLFLLLLGIWPRTSAVISLIFFTLITNVMASFAFGVDIYQSVCFFFLAIFPTGYSLSVIRKKEFPQIDGIKQLCVRVLQIYLILTYMSAGFEKALMPNWWNGKFIYFMINDPTIVTASFFPKAQNTLFYAFFGITVVLMECSYFIIIWIKKLRVILLLSILMMHIFIALFMDLFFFGILLIVLNTVSWYPIFSKDFKTSNHGKKI